MDQLNLFDLPEPPPIPKRKPKLKMDADALLRWKRQIFGHQQSVRDGIGPEQPALFDFAPDRHDADAIDPFSLAPHPWEFFDGGATGGQTCLYFVTDAAEPAPLLLYVGETKRSPEERWGGVHDCRTYIGNYIQLHRDCGLQVFVRTGFWWDVPTDRTARLKLERELILKWRSPFNKECWKWWGKPFG
ncbi:hypothetical protein [Lyngbya sp. CCY1209]|uniref:hypothetical protein n=1 Tax=Lyngbya sp. CCY1209 TaxID=2886103 RepID=UPI002D20A3B2|nr:hypothetical protein [Lyngbya sp. CCY1209]MEB3884075.1 hypothetical protein [Lyngbya sp. CCY1209]